MKRYFGWGLMALFFMPVISVAVLSFTNSFEVRELPVLKELPDFSLEERQGSEVTRDSLRGKVWIAAFVFANCESQCPMINQQMRKIQSALRFKERFRLVSITVDPERDTAEVLQRYADKLSADPYKWLFLTGSREEINILSQKGFQLASAQEADATHSSKLVLVDHFSRIRGYYEADATSVKTLIKDAKRLVKQAF